MKLIYTNDIHSNFPDGFKLIEELRSLKSNGDSILIDGGDFFEGNLFFNLFDGELEYLLFKELYDFIVPGNHGFNFVLRINNELKNVICCNILEHNSLLFKPYKIIGDTMIIGVLSLEAFYCINLIHRETYRVLDPIPEIHKYLKLAKLIKKKVIVISHSGIYKDFENLNSIAGINLVLSGHCHSKSNLLIGKRSHFIKCSANANSYIKIDLDTYGYNLVKVQDNLIKSIDLIKYKKKYDYQVREFNNFKIREEVFSRIKFSIDNLTSYLAESICEKFDADIFILNKFFIRDVFEKREVGFEDLYRVIPFDNFIIEITLNEESYFNLIKELDTHSFERLLKYKFKKKNEKIITSSYLVDQINYDKKLSLFEKKITFREFFIEILKY